MTGEARAQPAQTVIIGWRRSELNRLPDLVEQVEVEAPAAEIQTGVQH
jgi:hypothetical protein